MAKPSIRDKFKKQKENLVKRHQEQVDTKDDKQSYPTIFDAEKIPEGIGFWKCGKGDHIIDIIPFFAGKNHPKVAEGELAYVVDLYVHAGVGTLREPFVCQTKNFKKNDPICEYIANNRLPLEDWKKISPKRRTVYLVWVHDTPEEEEKGLQIWEVSHYFFENHVDEIAKSPRGGGAIAFSDIDSGKSIAFSVKITGKYKDATGTDRDSVSYLGHRFVDRDEPIPDDILSQIFPLDDVIKMHPSNDDVSTAFYGEEKAAKKNVESRLDRMKKQKEEEPDDDDEAFPAEDDEDETEEEEETEEEPEDEESNEDETCAVDDFGTGLDKHKECKTCPIWDDCSDEAEKLEAAKKKDKPKKGKGKK
jgi:hypothetical protein